MGKRLSLPEGVAVEMAGLGVNGAGPCVGVLLAGVVLAGLKYGVVVAGLGVDVVLVGLEVGVVSVGLEVGAHVVLTGLGAGVVSAYWAGPRVGVLLAGQCAGAVLTVNEALVGRGVHAVLVGLGTDMGSARFRVCVELELDTELDAEPELGLVGLDGSAKLDTDVVCGCEKISIHTQESDPSSDNHQSCHSIKTATR